MDSGINFNLEGKRVFITGGARGIGKAVGVYLARAGCDVAIVDLNYEMARDAADELKDLGVSSFAVKCDVTDPIQVDAMIDTVMKKFPTLDGAFNNAGICINENAEDMSYESWKKVIDVNLSGVFLTSRAAGQAMIPNKKGSIINTASMSGHIVNHPQPQCAYNASKAGVIMLTKSMAVEWAKYNVRVNSISPGYISTEMTLKVKDLIPGWIRSTPMNRMGTPEELAGAVLYLLSDLSAFTTGSDIIIDGAFTCL